MNHILDTVIGMPLFTNNNDQLFSWYTVYNDGAIIRELNDYSNINFNDIPKTDILHFGLYGCGFVLDCNFINGEVGIYGKSTNKSLLFTVLPTIDKKQISYQATPFTFKHFVLETDFLHIKNDKPFIDAYYAGYEGIVDDMKIKMYFSIRIKDYPTSIGIMYKISPINKIDQEKSCEFNLAEKVYTKIYDNEKVNRDNIRKLLAFNKENTYHRGRLIIQL